MLGNANLFIIGAGAAAVTASGLKHETRRSRWLVLVGLLFLGFLVKTKNGQEHFYNVIKFNAEGQLFLIKIKGKYFFVQTVNNKKIIRTTYKDFI